MISANHQPLPCSDPLVGLDRYRDVETMVRRMQPATPVYCLHPDALKRAAQRFLQGFPGKTLYAVKANPHPAIVRTLYDAGIRHFDTASLEEMDLVTQLCPDATCYFMAVARLRGAARTAFEKYGVRHFVADHISEVERLLEFADHQTTIHIRMKAFDPSSVYELSSKFGADEEELPGLLRRVADAGCKVGLAFNVGSLVTNPRAYGTAIGAAARVIKAAGVEITSLDMGGGFPIAYPGLETGQLDDFFATIRETFAGTGLPSNFELLCEPGRALSAEGQSLVTQVILIKDDLVFLNDGIYGGLQELDISKGHVKFPARVISEADTPSDRMKPWRISGPTCDTLDIFSDPIELPDNLREGDWVVFSLAGAYTNAMATRFNGLYADTWVRIESDD